MTVRAATKYLVGLLLAAVLLWWVLRDTDGELLLAQLRRVWWPGLVACCVLNLGHNVFRVWRWRALLDPVRRDLPFRPMFDAVILGYMTSWLLPGRIGELVRPLALAGKERVPLGPCIGSVVADRLLDGGCVVVLFILGVWLTPLDGPSLEYAAIIRSTAVVAAVGMVGAIGAMLLLHGNREPLGRWLEGRPNWVRWVGRTGLAVSEGVGALRSSRLALRIVVHSALAWGVICLATWLGIRSAGAEISFSVVMFIMPLLVLGVAVPTPGGAGSYHGMMKLGLLLFGVGEIEAVSAGLLVHLAITVPVIVLGVVLLWVEGISWRDLTAGARQLRELGAPVEGPSGGGGTAAAETIP